MMCASSLLHRSWMISFVCDVICESYLGRTHYYYTQCNVGRLLNSSSPAHPHARLLCIRICMQTKYQYWYALHNEVHGQSDIDFCIIYITDSCKYMLSKVLYAQHPFDNPNQYCMEWILLHVLLVVYFINTQGAHPLFNGKKIKLAKNSMCTCMCTCTCTLECTIKNNLWWFLIFNFAFSDFNLKFYSHTY